MPSNPVAENVLGTIGAICWTGQVLPQIWKSYRAKSTDGLSHWLMFLWGCGAAFLGVFAVVQNLNVPLIVQPILLGILSFISWSQCMYYGKKKSLIITSTLLGCALVLFGGFLAGMIYAVRPSYNRGNDGPTEFFGICSAVLISGGLLPQYWEIWKYGEVKGISLPFMTIDLLGGVFSDLSLGFKPQFDPVAGVTYSLVVLLDGLVLVAAAILNPRANRRRRREAELNAEDGRPSEGQHMIGMNSVPEADTPQGTVSILHDIAIQPDTEKKNGMASQKREGGQKSLCSANRDYVA